MKEYLISLVLVVAVTAIASAVFPEGGRLRPQFNFLLAIVILSTLLLPIGRLDEFTQNLGESFSAIFENENRLPEGEGVEWLNAEREKAFEEAVKLELCRSFGLRSDDVEIDGSLNIRENKIYVDSLKLSLSGVVAAGDNKGMKKFLSELCGIECEVKIGE